MRIRWFVLASVLAVGCKGGSEAQKAPAPVVAAAPRDAAPAADAAPAHPTSNAPPIEAAIEQAKTAHKPLVLEFGTTWCHPCQIFETTTLADARVKAALDRIMFVRYDAEAGAGVAAAKRYNVSSFPTFIAVDGEGTVRITRSGLEGDGVAEFTSLIDHAETATMSESDVRARLAAAPKDNAVRIQAARWFVDRNMTNDALAQLDAVANDHAATDVQRAEARGTTLRLRRVAKWHADLVAEKLELARTAPAAITESDLVIATVDSGAPAATVRDAIAKVLATRTKPDDLNPFLYVALAAGAKDEALAAAKRVLGEIKQPNLLDTLAECYHVHGDTKDAVATEDRALALADPATAAALGANRTRFASGQGDSDEVTRLHARAKQIADSLAHADEEKATVADAASVGMPDGMPAAEGDIQAMATAFFTANKALSETATAACASVAGTSKGAFVGVTSDKSGKITAATVFADAAASEALRACISNKILGATLPPPPPMMDPMPIQISFGGAMTH